MKTQSLPIVTATLLSLAFIVSSCSSAQSDWAKAARDNTVSGYKDFLTAHPNDQHANEAQTMILRLQDDNAWAEAKNSGTSAAYETYLQQSPLGSHATAARDAITAMERATAWKSAQGMGTAASIQAFLQKYPTGPEADQAKATLKDLAAYRMHLATETSNAKAERKLSQLKSRLGAGTDFAITPDATGKSFSIDSPGMTEQEAKSACDSIKRKHEACQVVKQ